MSDSTSAAIVKYSSGHRAFVLALGLASSAGAAQAAQLGRLDVLSAPGEPLRAEIQVSQIQDNEREGLLARLAGADAYRAARLAMSSTLAQLRFELVPNEAEKTAVIRINGPRPIAAPYQDFIVEVSWAGGRIQREYTLADKKISAVVPPEALATTSSAPSPSEGVANSQRPNSDGPSAPDLTTPLAPVARLAPATAPLGDSNKPYTVKAGDSLSGLAQSLLSEGGSLEQIMAALYENNPKAFINGGIHLLREGAVLNLPNKSQIDARTRSQAIALLSEYDERAADRRRRLSASPTRQANRGRGGDEVRGRIVNQAPASAAPQKEDQLKVGRALKAPAESVAEQDNAAAEELLAREKALQEANERIQLLEKNVGDLQKLLSLKGEAAKPAVPAVKPPVEPVANTDPSSVPLPAVEPIAAKPWFLQTWSLIVAGVGLGGLIAALIVGIQRRRAAAKNDATPPVAPVVQTPAVEPTVEPVVVAVTEPVELPATPPAEPSVASDVSAGDASAIAELPSEQVTADTSLDLEFPTDAAAMPERTSSILDDLDEMDRQTEAATAEIAQLQTASVTENDISAAEADAPPNQPLDEATWQEMATKLDLAAAYIDIGDADGARELLEEVIGHGDPDQVRKAKDLMKDFR
ncbi:MAG: FimV family protein [Burkholderiaceae bacterium]